MTALQRFEHFSIPEPNSGCWIWMGIARPDGYGIITYGEKGRKRAHVYAYETFIGAIPKGLLVRHTCDMPCCVNPAHLLLGTHKQNTADAIKRNRFWRGSQHGSARLTEEQVILIRKDPRKQRDIAKDYGVCQMTISFIKQRKTWTHI